MSEQFRIVHHVFADDIQNCGGNIQLRAADRSVFACSSLSYFSETLKKLLRFLAFEERIALFHG